MDLLQILILLTLLKTTDLSLLNQTI